MQRDFKGIWIDRSIWLRKDLTCVEKCLLSEIDSLDFTEQHCFASNAYFAEFLGVSVPTITRAIKKLESINLISIQTEKSEKGTKKTITALIKLMRGANQNDETPTNQNDYHNNTIDINNTDKTIIMADFDVFWDRYDKKAKKKDVPKFKPAVKEPKKKGKTRKKQKVSSGTEVSKDTSSEKAKKEVKAKKDAPKFKPAVKEPKKEVKVKAPKKEKKAAKKEKSIKVKKPKEEKKAPEEMQP